MFAREKLFQGAPLYVVASFKDFLIEKPDRTFPIEALFFESAISGLQGKKNPDDNEKNTDGSERKQKPNPVGCPG